MEVLLYEPFVTYDEGGIDLVVEAPGTLLWMFCEHIHRVIDAVWATWCFRLNS